MKSSFIILVTILATCSHTMCQDLSGIWSGTLSQGGRIVFTTELTMKQLGTMLAGTYKCTLGDRIWVIEKFTGSIERNAMVLTETEVVDRGPADEGYCLKILNGILTTNDENRQYVYQGRWTSKKIYGAGKYIDYECTPGEFKMSKRIPSSEGKTSVVRSTPLIPVMMIGQVLDKYTNRSVKASISIEGKNLLKQTLTTPHGGFYSFKVYTNTDYIMVISADNYEQKREMITLNSPSMNKNFYLIPKAAEVQPEVVSVPARQVTEVMAEMKNNKPILLKNVLFLTNSDVLLSTSHEALNNLAAQMKGNSRLKIRIEGHTARYPNSSPQANLALSLKRAAMVKQYLFGKGISADRIETKGYGDTKLIDSPMSSKNMRVEFVILNQ